jgi:hypothetical protein
MYPKQPGLSGFFIVTSVQMLQKRQLLRYKTQTKSLAITCWQL